MSLLFTPIQFGNLGLSNRIIIAPMCQYSANQEGEITFWHEQQWAKYALSGAGLCIVEATAVQREGRISFADVGLWNDVQAEKIKIALEKIKSISPTPMAVQLAHAGRKAASNVPWEGGKQFAPDHKLGWQTVSASDLPFGEDGIRPVVLTREAIQQIVLDFAAAAKRAVYAGFQLIEIHAAHGYLLHQFLSPLSNQRSDEYGGSFENRIRFTLEVIAAVKAVVPEGFPVGVRISATDWMDEQQGWDENSSVKLAQEIAQLDVAYIHVSSGGLDAKQKIEVHSCYQVPFADLVKKSVNVPVIAVGLITEPMEAEGILDYGQADAIAIGRVILYNPNWPWHAAAELDATIGIAPQYLRCEPRGFENLFTPF